MAKQSCDREAFWSGDDVSSCFQHWYLAIGIPLALVAISFLSIAINFIVKLCQKSHGQKCLSGVGEWGSGEIADITSQEPYRDEPEISTKAGCDTGLHGSSSADARTEVSSLADDKNPKLTLKQVRPKRRWMSILLEMIMLIGLISIKCYRLSQQHHITESAVGLLIWSYTLLLSSSRFWAPTRIVKYLPNLWYHTTWIYGIQWLCAALQFRSQIIHPTGEEDQRFTIVNFSMISKLFLTALITRKGNKTVILEYEDDLAPSKEPLASLISSWTFAWVDTIVWQGYKKTLELSDVWSLAASDKAAAVLADFRQVHKTNALAWHLLKYFKKELIIQALWAVISGLFTFAPTLLLKVFLEYVEDPEDNPVNAAWFYMILLALSSCIKSVTDGQALWLGRRVCIRLRAIIVGEIYAKALRRKAASGQDTVLGKEESKVLNTTQTAPESSATAKVESKKDDTDDKKPEDDSQANVGTIINLMAVDSFKVSEISAYLHFLWGSTPIQLVVCVVLLYRILGLSSLAGIVMMVLVMPLNFFIAKQFSKTQKLVMAATDVRIHTTNEILQNIRIVKYFAWEQRFGDIVSEKRHAELKALRNKYILWTGAAGVWFGVPILITFFSFLLYTVIEQRPLVPSVAFTALSLFGILRYPLDQLADMIAHVQESKVSIDRIEQFLKEDETKKYVQLDNSEIQSDQPDGGDLIEVGFRNACLAWYSKCGADSDAVPESFQLIDIDVQFRVGQLNIIAGPTGSGKTSLLMGLLGEMSLLEGQIYLPHAASREDLVPDKATGLTESVAFCAQQAWLINDNVRQNILFAAPFDEARYRAVISACALERDLEILDQGDLTLVGEKGITLSGGQKQRISLARALYSNSRHVLLDDCLSAVDSHTAKHIFEFCISGPLMSGRTCILVTHNLTLCAPRAQHIVALHRGRVVAQGGPEVMINSGALGDDIQRSRPGSKVGSALPSRVPSVSHLQSSSSKASSINCPEQNLQSTIKQPQYQPKTPARPPPTSQKSSPQSETKAQGSVSFQVILMYLAAMGRWYYWLLAVVAFSLQQLGSVGANVWIRTWANAYVSSESSESKLYTQASNSMNRNRHAHAAVFAPGYQSKNGLEWISTFSPAPSQHIEVQSDVVDPWYYLRIYAALGLFYILISLVREGLIFWGSLKASATLHRRLFEAVTRAKLQFFDTTPLGQLMNRFSKDIEAVDQDISPVAVGVLGCLFSLISIILLICIITPRFLIAGVFISLVYFAIGAFYLRSSRDLKRLESVQRSPIYQQFGETLSGMVTIRAYGEERRFIRQNQHRVDTHNRPFIYLWATNRWLALRVDFAGALVAFFAGVFIILAGDSVDAGSAGLSLTYAVMFTENVLWLVRLYSANEQNMNSVERLKEYMEIEQEAQAIVPDTRPPGNWPSHGGIQFFDYTTRYRSDLEPVLRDLTFQVLPGERIGIVGRTGAGKSSLALALFRGLEADSGKILIDDVDIGLIGLQDLREAITIVPQDPTLFTGTIRSNLDPFGLFTDEEIFAVLRRVQLIDSPTNDTTPRPSSTDSAVPNVILTSPGDKYTPATAHSSRSSDQTRQGTDPPSPHDSADEEEGETLLKKKHKVTSMAKTPVRENANIFTNLSSSIAESGSNLSQGQRQLLCLARALLKSPRVLVMDEATASIDYATDTHIQATLREVRESTVITIAHRLQTIIDYDKVLVLDRGRLVEYDSPATLIQNESSIFRGMCEMSGDLDGLVNDAINAAKAKNLIHL